MVKPFPVHWGGPPHQRAGLTVKTVKGLGESPPLLTLVGWGALQYWSTEPSSVLSLRGVLPQWLLDEADVPGMAIRVKDGRAVPTGVFDVANAWLDAHVSYSWPGPIISCWLAQSRSVVFAAVWLAHHHQTGLTRVFEHLYAQYSAMAPHIELVRSAYRWAGEEIPEEVAKAHSEV